MVSKRFFVKAAQTWVRRQGSPSSSARTRSSSPHKVSALSGLPEPIKIAEINPYEDNSLSSAVQELVTQVSEYAG